MARIRVRSAICFIVVQLILFHFILKLRADPDDGYADYQSNRDEGVHTHFRNMKGSAHDILVVNEDQAVYGVSHDSSSRGRQKRQAGAQTSASAPPGPPVNASEASKYVVQDVTVPPGYNIYQIPKDPVHGGALPIFIYIRIKKILDFDELNEVINLDIEFQVMWTDFLIMYLNNRTRNSSDEFVTAESLSPAEVKSKRRTLNNPYILDKVWKPNLFIENLLSVQQPNLMGKLITIKFIPDVGWFEYITRISVKLSCEMNFHYYPADTQECDFALRGFAYNKSDLNLNWYKNGVFMEQVDMQSFDLQLTNRRKYEWMKNNDPSDIFTVLGFKILARRRLNYHLVQTYLSSSFYMFITCLCFVLPQRMIEAKIGMSMTALLTLTSMFASVRGNTPVVSYVKAIDIWMVCCIFFVFLTLCQYTLITWFKTQLDNAHEEHSQIHRTSSSVLFVASAALKDLQPKRDNVANGAPGAAAVPKPQANGAAKGHHRIRTLSDEYRHIERVEKYHRLINWFEKYSFALFLGLFALYNVVYWTFLLVRADYFNWKVNRTLNNVEVDI